VLECVKKIKRHYNLTVYVKHFCISGCSFRFSRQKWEACDICIKRRCR